MGIASRDDVMAVHDWTRVEAGIFHDFHHAWIEEIKRALNNGVLPDDYYALAEQFAAGLGPDVLTLQGSGDGEADAAGPPRMFCHRQPGPVLGAPPLAL